MKVLPVCVLAAVLGAGQMFAASAAEGKTVFNTKCKGCHGAEGQGNPAIAKMMKVEMHPFSSAEVQGKSDAELKKDITQGVGKMKPQTLTAKQADDVVAYIRTLKK